MFDATEKECHEFHIISDQVAIQQMLSDCSKLSKRCIQDVLCKIGDSQPEDYRELHPVDRIPVIQVENH